MFLKYFFLIDAGVPDIYPPVIDMVIGGMVVFTCFFPDPVEWSFNGGPVPPNAHHISDHVLLVNDLTSKDAGVYFCTDTNDNFRKYSDLRIFGESI